MGLFKQEPSDFVQITVNGQKRAALSRPKFQAFNSSLLGLGDLTKEATTLDAIAATFDLEGFTYFCSQIDPEYDVPVFLNQFLHWVMEQFKVQIAVQHPPPQMIIGDGVVLYHPFPFFIKFLGDGLLVLLDASQISPVERRNFIVICHRICEEYKSKFAQSISDRLVHPPRLLRCGVARGKIYSVGDGNDFVGSCINMSARIQRLPGITFAFNRRGFDFDKLRETSPLRDYVFTHVTIRGISDDEIIGISKIDWKALNREDRKSYRVIKTAKVISEK